MRKINFFIICLCLFVVAVMPAQAFTAKSLTMTLAADGNAEIDMHYDLTLFEECAVFFRITDPAAELKKAFDDNSKEPVTIKKATASSATVIIPSFASVSENDGKTIMVTPSLSFTRAQKVLDQYWFAPLISPDFSPDVTEIIFPDGYRTTYNNTLTIPSVTHQLE